MNIYVFGNKFLELCSCPSNKIFNIAIMNVKTFVYSLLTWFVTFATSLTQYHANECQNI